MKNFNEHPINIVPYNKRNDYERIIELSSEDLKEMINSGNEKCDHLLGAFLEMQFRRSEFFCDKESPYKGGTKCEHFDFHAMIEYNWGVLSKAYCDTIGTYTKVYAYSLSEEFYNVVNSCNEFLHLLTEPELKNIDFDSLKKDLLKMNEYIKKFYIELNKNYKFKL